MTEEAQEMKALKAALEGADFTFSTWRPPPYTTEQTQAILSVEGRAKKRLEALPVCCSKMREFLAHDLVGLQGRKVQLYVGGDCGGMETISFCPGCGAKTSARIVKRFDEIESSKKAALMRIQYPS